MTEQEKLNLVTNYFAEDWAIDKAMQLLEDYENMTGNSSASEADNVLHSFWVLLGEAETQADNDNNPLLKHQVEGFYRQWNTLNGSALEPRWMTRAARKQGAKHD